MRQYSSDLVEVTWGIPSLVAGIALLATGKGIGLQLHEGLARGTFIQPKRTAATWSQKDDGYGGTVRLFNPSLSGTLNLIMDLESEEHAILNAIANADLLLQSIRAPLLVYDVAMKELTAYLGAYIQTIPDPSKSTGLGSVAWPFLFREVQTQRFGSNANRVGV